MNENFVVRKPLSQFSPWDLHKTAGRLFSLEFELTVRCNNNCRHCYINLEQNDPAANALEPTFDEIDRVAEEAVSMGAVWCLLTGGEPLLREDFADIYLSLKKKGFLVSVFTNATLVTAEHVRLFQSFPPRDLDVSVYGVSKSVYEKVSRTPGSFRLFRKGLQRLLDGGIRVQLKAMVMRSNFSEFNRISEFCRNNGYGEYRFDPFLHLRCDGDARRNREILSERLRSDEIVDVEQRDPIRARALQKNCNRLIIPEFRHKTDRRIFFCGAGVHGVTIGADGRFRLCSSSCHPDWSRCLRNTSLCDFWQTVVPIIRETISNRSEYLEKCRVCPIINLCMWCPAQAFLETSQMDQPVEYFCEVAHARARALEKQMGQ